MSRDSRNSRNIDGQNIKTMKHLFIIAAIISPFIPNLTNAALFVGKNKKVFEWITLFSRYLEKYMNSYILLDLKILFRLCSDLWKYSSEIQHQIKGCETFKFKASLLFFSIEFSKVSSTGICITKTYFHWCFTPFPFCIRMYSKVFLRALILILTCWSVFLTLFHIQISNFSNTIYFIS